jgi:hypothetical protein
MKKNLTLLTGIVFVFTILVAVGCNQNDINDLQLPDNDGRPPITWEELDTVIIFLKAVDENGEKHLQMYDSNDISNIVVDSLTTFVRDSTLVIWTLTTDSEIRRLKKIKPKKDNGVIMPGPATGFFNFKKKKHRVPVGQTEGAQEGYLIRFKCTDGTHVEIDPHLRIPPQR